MEEFDLTTDGRSRLVLRRSGQDDVADVRLRRVFPLTCADAFISIRSSEGSELLLIESLADVPPRTRSVIEQALTAATFVPRISKVHGVDVQFGYQEWTVQTDRGPAAFRVQEREDIRFLEGGRFRIKDVDGTVYEMDSLDQLDDASRRAVEPLV